jgi:hypothetical protein
VSFSDVPWVGRPVLRVPQDLSLQHLACICAPTVCGSLPPVDAPQHLLRHREDAAPYRNAIHSNGMYSCPNGTASLCGEFLHENLTTEDPEGHRGEFSDVPWVGRPVPRVPQDLSLQHLACICAPTVCGSLPPVDAPRHLLRHREDAAPYRNAIHSNGMSSCLNGTASLCSEFFTKI